MAFLLGSAPTLSDPGKLIGTKDALSMELGYVVSFGFLLPINAPQNMVCIGTETFTARQFLHAGIWLTLIGYILMLVFALTWWRWLGWI